MIAVIISAVTSIGISDDVAAVSIFSIAGLDLSLWLLSRGIGLMQNDLSTIPLLIGP